MRDGGAQTLPARGTTVGAAMLAEAQVSSMTTNHEGSRSGWASSQSQRRIRTSGQFCLAACAVFFPGGPVPLEEGTACRSRTGDRARQEAAQFLDGGITHLVGQLRTYSGMG